MVRYSAILNRQAVIDHLSEFIDDIEDTDFPKNLDNLALSPMSAIKLKYEDGAKLRLMCVIRKADTKKFALTGTIVGGM